ncbi:MAG TPA: hypothetical protein C5S50_03800 [Methanosarcinaceae archaeon]|nr:hypothetical protein [Methanosarcinaceae archaeon]
MVDDLWIEWLVGGGIVQAVDNKKLVVEWEGMSYIVIVDMGALAVVLMVVQSAVPVVWAFRMKVCLMGVLCRQ